MNNLTTLEELKKKLQSYTEEKKENKTKENIVLQKEIVEFFLKKIDAYKFLNRIIEHYNIPNNEAALVKFFKEKLGLPFMDKNTKIGESFLKNIFIEKDMPNKILNIDEKRKLKDLYLNEHIEKAKKELTLKQKETQLLREDVLAFIFRNKHLLRGTVDTEKLNKKQISRLKGEKEQSKIFEKILSKTLNDNETRVFNLISAKIANYVQILNKNVKVKVKEQKINKLKLIEEEQKKTKEYHQKIEEFKKKQEEELLKKIKDRKNGVSKEDINKKPSKTEPIIIEAYLADFNSSRSRFVMAVLTANNINLAFYNGLIKLINEDNSFDEVYFSTNGSILRFSSKKHPKDISIDTSSFEKLNDILLKQSNNRTFIDTVLNCLSVLHYINTFYNEREKIEISFEDINTIKINNNDEDNERIKSIVYLSKSQNKKSIRTIKIKKGKRQIEGTFLIRGHWRRQKYLDGAKLIWIEPFWKGIGKEKQRVYKILKQY